MAVMTVRGELSARSATAQLVDYNLSKPAEGTYFAPSSYRLELCLTSRGPNAQAAYLGRWSAHRFVQLGRLVVLPPGHPLQYRHASGRQASVVCQLSEDAVRERLGDDIHWTDRRLEESLNISDACLRNILYWLAREVRNPGLRSDVLADLIANQLAIELHRYYTTIDNARTLSGLSAHSLRVIDERLADTSQRPRLEELAQLCNLSVRQLTRGFRVSRGCSINEYLEQQRVEIAKRRLTEGERIDSVARAMGFCSSSSFTRAFRQTTGSTPREFRAQVLAREPAEAPRPRPPRISAPAPD